MSFKNNEAKAGVHLHPVRGAGAVCTEAAKGKAVKARIRLMVMRVPLPLAGRLLVGGNFSGASRNCHRRIERGQKKTPSRGERPFSLQCDKD
jgi:hypothetical protein